MAPAAVVLGDPAWLRARHVEGLLTNPIEDTGGLRHAHRPRRRGTGRSWTCSVEHDCRVSVPEPL